MKIYFSLLDLLYQGPRSKFLSGGGAIFGFVIFVKLFFV